MRILRWVVVLVAVGALTVAGAPVSTAAKDVGYEVWTIDGGGVHCGMSSQSGHRRA